MNTGEKSQRWAAWLQVNFRFQVQFLLSMSWTDERINTKCDGAGTGAKAQQEEEELCRGQIIQSSDKCSHYWKPDMCDSIPCLHT